MTISFVLERSDLVRSGLSVCRYVRGRQKLRGLGRRRDLLQVQRDCEQEVGRDCVWRVPDRWPPRQVSDALLCGQLVIGSRGQGWGSGACTEGRGRPCTAVWRLGGTALNQLHGRVNVLRIDRVIVKQDVVSISVAGLHIHGGPTARCLLGLRRLKPSSPLHTLLRYGGVANFK